MFYRNERNALTFDRLEFEILIADIIDNISPKNIKDLNWMVKKMVDSIQLCAYEYDQNNDHFVDEWEDIYLEM